MSALEIEAIRAARRAQNLAIAHGDHAAIVSCWTEDITVRRALGQAVTGTQEALAALLVHGAAPLVYQRTTLSVEVSSQWPLAFEEGRWCGYRGDLNAAACIGGRYAAQWVKRDGRWLIRAEIFVALEGEAEERTAHLP